MAKKINPSVATIIYYEACELQEKGRLDEGLMLENTPQLREGQIIEYFTYDGGIPRRLLTAMCSEKTDSSTKMTFFAEEIFRANQNRHNLDIEIKRFLGQEMIHPENSKPKRFNARPTCNGYVPRIYKDRR